MMVQIEVGRAIVDMGRRVFNGIVEGRCVVVGHALKRVGRANAQTVSPRQLDFLSRKGELQPRKVKPQLGVDNIHRNLAALAHGHQSRYTNIYLSSPPTAIAPFLSIWRFA